MAHPGNRRGSRPALWLGPGVGSSSIRPTRDRCGAIWVPASSLPSPTTSTSRGSTRCRHSERGTGGQRRTSRWPSCTTPNAPRRHALPRPPPGSHSAPVWLATGWVPASRPRPRSGWRRSAGCSVSSNSFLPEVMAGYHAGMAIVAFTFVSTMSAGIAAPIALDRVLETTRRSHDDFRTIVSAAISGSVSSLRSPRQGEGTRCGAAGRGLPNSQEVLRAAAIEPFGNEPALLPRRLRRLVLPPPGGARSSVLPRHVAPPGPVMVQALALGSVQRE